mgnify:CR=1 FL=1
MNDNDECYIIDEFIEEDDDKQQHIDTNVDFPGFLLLDKTFGKKNKRFLYKVQPFNRELPSLLIPYDKPVGFSKEIINKYILFRYQDLKKKPAYGILIRSLGDVTNLNAYYEYMIYGKNIRLDNSLLKKQVKTLVPVCENENIDNYVETIFNKYVNIYKYDDEAITIDSPGTEHFDDALSISIQNNITKISIYITNVCIWLEELNLWNFLGNEMKTIYLPNKKISMFPNEFIQLCNLKAYNKRIALCINIYIVNNKIVEVQIKNKLIKVLNNFYYESKELLRNETYKKLMKFTQQYNDSVKNSYELVSYWMIFVNKLMGEKFAKKEIGIFKINYNNYDNYVIEKLIQEKGINYYELNSEGEYIQLTSPLRKKADVLNQLFLMQCFLGYNFINSDDYVSNFVSSIDEKNTLMKEIRKVENHCDIVSRLVNENDEEKIYEVEDLGPIKKIKGLNRIVQLDDDVKKIKIKIINKMERKSVRMEKV